VPPTLFCYDPNVQAKRIYEKSFIPRGSYLLRFATPEGLQSFLKEVPFITVYGKPLEARLFRSDANPLHIRPKTLLNQIWTPQSTLARRNRYFRESSGALVLVEGIPKNTNLGSISYVMQVEFREEQFEWAFEWANRPGEGEKYEANAIPIGSGYVFYVKGGVNV
jgi:hypothetical protein